MQRRTPKNHRIDTTPRELYKSERAKYQKLVKENVSKFGMRLIHGEYKAKIVLFLAAIAVIVVFSAFPLYLYNLAQAEDIKRIRLVADISEQKRIFQYERNIVISSEVVDKVQKAATEIAIIQNKYIIAVLEGAEVVTHIDRELEFANYLQEEDCVAWINMRDRETLKSVFNAGDFYWVGYADNTLSSYSVTEIPVFFILYDDGYPVQIIEYQYDVKNDILKNEKDWG